ncbi:SprT family protein [Alkalicoccus daliensis]|nr:SprT family protein [Alkalicoccus daliensis]
MNNEELQRLTEEISLDFFRKRFKHKASFNKRLRTTGGRYALQSHNIEINPKHLEHYGRDEVISIIKHELCHYHLHIEGRGYQHRDREFKQLLKQVGGSRHCQSIPAVRNKSVTIHVYRCLTCSHEYLRKRRMNTKKYVCGKCHGRLEKTAEKNEGKTLTAFQGI